MSGHGHGNHSQLKEVLLDISKDDGRQPFEAVADASIIETKITTSKKHIVFALFFVDVLTNLLIMIGGVCGFNLSTFETKLLTTNSTIGFDIGTSTIDVVIVDLTRWCILFLFVLAICCCSTTKSIPYHDQLLNLMQRRTTMPRPSSSFALTLQSTAWWLLFSWTTWSITKVSMLDWQSNWHHANPAKMWCVVMAALFSIIELKYTNDFLSSQIRTSELYRLLLTDLAVMEDEDEAKATLDASGETKTSTSNKQKTTTKDESMEDPRSRFYEDPEKKRAQLLKPVSTMSTMDHFTGLWKIMRAYVWPSGCSSKVRIFATFIVMGGSKVCALLYPMYIGQATQILADQSVVPYREIAIYTTLQFSSVGLTQIQKIVYLGVKQHAFAEIATTTFRHLHSLSLDWHLQKKMGTVLRIMDRGIASADQVMNYLVLYLLPSIVQAFIVFGLFYVKFNSAELAGVAFLSFVAYCVVTIQITMWRKKFRKATNKHDNKYHDLATDSLINFETVKYFANEEHEIKNFRHSVEQYQKHNIATQVSLAVLNSAQQLDIQITTCIALMLSATTILHTTGSLDLTSSSNIGAFVSVNAYILQLYAPLSYLGTIYSTVVQAFVDMGNLSEMLSVGPDVSDIHNAQQLVLRQPKNGARIEFSNVKFAYPSQPSKGLRGVSFVVEPGTTTAIVGPTGAGKSTISRLLFRFYDCNNGTITIDNQNIANITQKSLRSSIGVVPQDTVLFNSTMKHNIQYGNVNANFHLLEKAAESAQILPFINSLEENWNTMVGERGLKISGGEKQRVAIARCLLKNPPIVLLDEATSALDSQTEVAVQEALATLGQGRTQVVIAHRLSTIMKAEQILVLDQGLIVERGTHVELLAMENGLYQKLWNAQERAGDSK